MADGDPMLLEEITGDGRRTLALVGSDLPNRPVRVGGSQRLKTSWYPGAEEASVQVLGTSEEPIMLRGILNDVWTGLSGQALQIRSDLESLRMRQRRIRLTWGTEIDVEGFLEKTAFQIERTSLIRYELVFMVALGDQPEAIAVTPFPQASESQLVDALNDGVNSIDDNTPSILTALDAVAAIV